MLRKTKKDGEAETQRRQESWRETAWAGERWGEGPGGREQCEQRLLLPVEEEE